MTGNKPGRLPADLLFPLVKRGLRDAAPSCPLVPLGDPPSLQLDAMIPHTPPRATHGRARPRGITEGNVPNAHGARRKKTRARALSPVGATSRPRLQSCASSRSLPIACCGRWLSRSILRPTTCSRRPPVGRLPGCDPQGSCAGSAQAARWKVAMLTSASVRLTRPLPPSNKEGDGRAASHATERA